MDGVIKKDKKPNTKERSVSKSPKREHSPELVKNLYIEDLNKMRLSPIYQIPSQDDLEALPPRGSSKPHIGKTPEPQKRHLAQRKPSQDFPAQTHPYIKSRKNSGNFTARQKPIKERSPSLTGSRPIRHMKTPSHDIKKLNDNVMKQKLVKSSQKPTSNMTSSRKSEGQDFLGKEDYL